MGYLIFGVLGLIGFVGWRCIRVGAKAEAQWERELNR